MGIGVANTQNKMVLVVIRDPIFAQAREQFIKTYACALCLIFPQNLTRPQTSYPQITFKMEYQQLNEVDHFMRQ
jgi:hypothetical protein